MESGFITPVKLDLDIPPDQFISNNGTGQTWSKSNFYSTGPFMMIA
jgi:hypothetical protein